MSGPNGHFVLALVEISFCSEEEEAAVGDKISLPESFQSPHYEILDAILLENHRGEYRGNEREDDYMCVGLRIRVPQKSVQDCLEFTGPRQVKINVYSEYVSSGAVLATTDSHIDVEVAVKIPGQRIGKFMFMHNTSVLESKLFTDLWRNCQNRKVKEGVLHGVGQVPHELKSALSDCINHFADTQPADYHPGTHNVVRDYVHPSIYPYIKGVSKLEGMADLTLEKHAEDFWGRPYEESVYQWLPAEFHVDENGKSSIETYINNLPKALYPALYGHLEKLFDIFFPQFERVYSYGKCLKFPDEEGGMYDAELPQSLFDEPPPISLRGRQLQVVTKIVDYELDPKQSFEGVWHVEGMSHENIVATGIYVIERSASIEGGDLLFKRAFLEGEAGHIYLDVPQSRHQMLDKIVGEGLVPLGKIHTGLDQMIVFPNSHVHKVDWMVNKGNEPAHRRIIVFFLVNPERRIVSSRDIKPQQGILPHEDALQHRIKLMEERKRHKQDWNVRAIELCEH